MFITLNATVPRRTCRTPGIRRARSWGHAIHLPGPVQALFVNDEFSAHTFVNLFALTW